MNMVHAKVKNGSHTCLYFGKIWQTSIPAQEKKCKFNSIFGGKSNLSHVHKPKTTPVQYALKPIIYEDNQPGGMGIINQSSLMKTFFSLSFYPSCILKLGQQLCTILRMWTREDLSIIWTRVSNTVAVEIEWLAKQERV